MTKDLEKVVKKRVQPVVESSMQKLLGVTIEELSEDISEKIGRSPLFDFSIDTSVSFKEAKLQFKKQYVQRLLQVNYGNVSEVARVADIDRRSVHRMVKQSAINVRHIRQEMAKAYEIRQAAVGSIIQDVLDHYKEVIHPSKLGVAYEHVSDVSKDILGHLPEDPLSLKDAEEEFEKEYLQKALREQNNNIMRTAKKIGLRYETLHRKAKKLGLI